MLIRLSRNLILRGSREIGQELMGSLGEGEDSSRKEGGTTAPRGADDAERGSRGTCWRNQSGGVEGLGGWRGLCHTWKKRTGAG